MLSSEERHLMGNNGIAVADVAITSSDFLKIIGISTPKGANRGNSGQF